MHASEPLAVPTDDVAPTGHRLGHFELRGVVARDADGVVYRAWDHELAIAVAIKEFLPLRLARRNAAGDIEALGADTAEAFERARDDFVNDTRLLARCDHASLVRVRQLLRAHGTGYRVMPWYVGWPLVDVRREMDTPPDEPALRRLLAELLGALQAWHRVGGVHGGVNPAHILLLDDDRALLLGPASAWRGGAARTAVPPAQAPAPSFLAPEQRAPSAQVPTGPWTDFFALAGVIRFCISGMQPPPGGPAPEPLQAMVEGLYFDAPDVRYSERFLRALDAAASPAIADRPRTAAEFLDWLDHGPRRDVSMAATSACGAAPADALASASVSADADADAGAGAGAGAGAAHSAAAGAPDGVADAATPPTPTPTPTPTAGLAATAPAGAAQEEAVDAATVDLIRRVIESIPDRHEPVLHDEPSRPVLRTEGRMDVRIDVPVDVPIDVPLGMPMHATTQAPADTPNQASNDATLPEALQGSAHDPIVGPAEAGMHQPTEWPPRGSRRRGRTAGRWALGALVLVAVGGFAAWQWAPEGLDNGRLFSSTAPQPAAQTAVAVEGGPAAAPPAATSVAPTASVATAASAAAEPAASDAADANTESVRPSAMTQAAALPAMPASAPETPLQTAALPAPGAAPDGPATTATTPTTPTTPTTQATQATPTASPTDSPATAAIAPSPAPPAAVPAPPAASTAPPLRAQRAAEPAAARTAERARPESPRAACGDRTQFSLYRCMQQQCAKPAWAGHAQCRQLKSTDRVD
jgi:hypothetical protein